MIKYSYIKLTGCLVAAALAPLCTSAQRINTEASVERLKSESLQFSYSDNASGIQLDQMDYYSQVGLGYDIEKGSFKRARIPTSSECFSLKMKFLRPKMPILQFSMSWVLRGK